MDKKTELISIVIPVYNSSKSLIGLVRELEETLKPSISYELMFIDDNSRDDSWQIISGLASSHTYVKGIRLCRNYGQHNALLCGILRSSGQIIITMDDDGQHPASAILEMIEHVAKGADVVYAYPIKERHDLLRDIASRLTKSALASAMGQQNARHASAYRAFRSDAKTAFDQYRGSGANVDVILTWAATRYKFIPVDYRERSYGQSGYTPLMLVRHAMNMMTGFTTRPLKLASYIGFTIALMGVLVMIYLLLLWILHGSSVPGFTFLASIVIIFSGAQLLALGIIGEYLARIHVGAMGRPPFLVREVL
jgi:glycosyltransferase involved in cell wall biosynthesis